MSTTYRKNVIAIISAYSSGSYLGAILSSMGYLCIHITTDTEWRIDRLRNYFRKGDFIDNFIIYKDSDIQEITKKYHITKIFVGSEPGIIIYDQLCKLTGIEGNDYEKSITRRNKYEMINSLKNYQLLSALQHKSNKLDDILSWYTNTIKLGKIVLKPLSSSSSDSVFYCANEQEISSAFSSIHNKCDMYNKVNEEVLAQQYIDGNEYIVNSVSCRGKHFITDIWKGYSADRTKVSHDQYADLVRADEAEFKVLCEYTQAVLDAVGIINGAGHSEIRLSSAGPCLIEIAARLPGKVDFTAISTIFGYNQLQLLITAALDPDFFLARPPYQYLARKYSRYVYLSSSYEGKVIHKPNFSDIMHIPSFYSLSFNLDQGDTLLLTSKQHRNPRPGYGYLIADTKEQLLLDYDNFITQEDKLYRSMLNQP